MEEGFRFCGLPEHLEVEALVSKWPDTHLPWTITDLVPGISEEELIRAVEWAFSPQFGWSGICGLQPVLEQSARNSRLLIGSRRIDGPGNILAECQLPSPGIRQVKMWLDISEQWTSETMAVQRAIQLPVVLRHEAGHGIGLGHAPSGSTNWMAPVYDPRVVKGGIWDIQESRTRYGLPKVTIPPAGDVLTLRINHETKTLEHSPGWSARVLSS